MWLPDGILDSVLLHLVTMKDYLRFGCVCKQWHFVAERQKRKRNPAPLLLVPTKDRSEKSRGLYSVAKDKLLDAELEIPYNRRCCGSSHGWLAFTEKDYRITLYNPFTKAKISLPPVADTSAIDIDEEGHDGYFPIFTKKVVLSADPSLCPDDYVVAALSNEPKFRTLALIWPGKDKRWIHFPPWSSQTGQGVGPTFDIIFDKSGKWIYASGDSGMLARAKVDRDAKKPFLELVVETWGYKGLKDQKYLVETTSGNGDLLMIVRIFKGQEGDDCFMETKDIKVFKLQGSKLLEVEDLDGEAVFIGDNASTAVSPSNFEGIEGDCIYYTDDFVEYSSAHYGDFGPHDIGKYNVKDKKYGFHYVPSKAQNHNMPPPVWIFPSLNLSSSP